MHEVVDGGLEFDGLVFLQGRVPLREDPVEGRARRRRRAPVLQRGDPGRHPAAQVQRRPGKGKFL